MKQKCRKGFATILIILLGLALAALGSITYLQLKPKLVPQSSPFASPVPTDETVHTDESRSVYTDEGTANWKTYASKDDTFSFKYPVETTIAPYETNEGITHLEFREKLPKDAPDGYELAPGFIMDFKAGFLGTKTIRGVAEDKIAQAKEYASITKSLTTTKINDYSGYTYSSVVQVETTYLFLSHQDNSYIGINYSVNDQNHKGYIGTINQILSTFQFLE